MSTVYLSQAEDREAFVARVFRQLEIETKAAGRAVLLKPNIVSHEPYPTTTHPAMLEACLQLLSGSAKSIIVSDGPAWDAGNSESILERHPLRKSCDRFGVPLVDASAQGARKVRTRSLKLEVSATALECDLMISLPVLKVHGICGLTGALKNQLGLLSVEEKRRLHFDLDVHRVIAELNEVVRPRLHIVDAIQTLRNTNEIRHGGKLERLGYMLAGTDPVSLDALGLELIAAVEPRLREKRVGDIAHIRHAVELGLGEPKYEIVETG